MKAADKQLLKNTLFCLGVVLLLASCKASDTDENASSRYRMTSEFTGTGNLLAIQEMPDDSYSLQFKPWISPYENSFSSEVLGREWVISLTRDNYYRITNREVGEEYSLDVVNDGVFDNLILAASDDVSGQHWRITSLDNGYCRLTNEFLGTEIALDITSDTVEPMLTMRPVGNFSGQHWKLTQIGMTGLLDYSCTGDSQ